MTHLKPMPIIALGRAETRRDSTALAVVRAAQRAGELVHLEEIPGQPGLTTCWPQSVRPEVTAALAGRGITAPWTHQAQAAALARDGRHVIIATRAASGKSAAYLAAALSAVLDGGTVLYLSPTKALAADQLTAIRSLGLPGVRATCYDGDATAADRAWAQAHANYLLTNPDMVHSGMLPNHARWRGFFRRLRVVIIDECHGYRGVFGSHVAHVLRRLRRVAAHHAAAGAGRRAGVHPRVGHHRRPGRLRPQAHRAGHGGRDRRRVTPLPGLVRPVGAAASCTPTTGPGPAARPPQRPPTCSPPWSRPRLRRSRSSARDAGRKRSRWPPGTRSTTSCRAVSPPTAPATCPTTAGGWKRRCAAAGSPAWPPPPRSSSASTSPAWTRY